MAKYAFIFIDPEVGGHESSPTPEEQQVYSDIFKWFDANYGTKIVDGGAEPQPTRTATTIRKGGGKVTVVDGPFIEAKESVGGVSIIEATDMRAAVEFAKTWP